MTVHLEDHTVIISSMDGTSHFPALMSDDRLVIETPSEKWLFRITFLSDKEMIWQKLYEVDSITVRLTRKITNQNKTL